MPVLAMPALGSSKLSNCKHWIFVGIQVITIQGISSHHKHHVGSIRYPFDS